MRRFRKRPEKRQDPDSTLGGRAAAAFVSGLFTLPVIGLIWLVFNSRMSVYPNFAIPAAYLVFAVLAVAAFSFAFPRLAPAVFGRLIDSLMGLGRYW